MDDKVVDHTDQVKTELGGPARPPKPGTSIARPSRSRFKRIELPAVVTCLGLVLTAWGVSQELTHLQGADRRHFDVLAERLRSEIRRRVDVYHAGLLGFRSLYVASRSVERDEFRAAVAAHDLTTEFPGARGIGYVRRVERASLADFLRETRVDGAPNFELQSRGDHEELWVIEFIEPLANNRTAEGLDVWPDRSRREAAERAMLTGQVALTGKLTLVQAQQSGPGFLYLVPIYRHHERLRTPGERRAALQGWVYMAIIAAQVMQGAADAAQGELDFEVFEGRELSLASLIYDDDSHLKSSGSNVRASFRDRAMLAFSNVEIGGQYWTTTISTSPRFQAQPRTAVWAIALAGVALSLLLGLYARSYTRT